MRELPAVPPVQRVGLSAFGALRAEDEPWLAACYVPPAEFDLMMSARAALIFGETGSGKTALLLALQRAWEEQAGANPWLLVRWHFSALVGASASLTGSALAARHLSQAFDAIARALLIHLGRQSTLWHGAPAWARVTLTWFVTGFLMAEFGPFVEALMDEGDLPPEAASVMHEIMEAGPHDLLPADAPPIAVMTELARALPRLGLSGVRVLVADMESWWETHAERLAESLAALLSMLALFEHPAFAYTFVLPDSLWPALRETTGVRRRRVQVFQLRFQEAELVRIVKGRLKLALGRSEAKLSDLIATDHLQPVGKPEPLDRLYNWLKGCGGTSPRGWLETIRPFLAAYLARSGAPQPLSAKECRSIQMQHPPLVWLDPAAGQVTIGWRRVSGLSPGQFAILRCLSERAGGVCSRKLLYRAYQHASNEDYREEDNLTELDITATLDSALYRLRNLIEPLPGASVLLETKKGQGVRLRIPARE